VKAVLDPNILVSALISPLGVPARVLGAWSNEYFELVISQAVLDELREVLARPSFRRRITVEEVAEYVDGLEADSELVEDPGEVPVVSRDPDDDYLIALARSAGADYIVSGDKDLTSLTELQPPVLTPRAFLDLLGG
jgi:putative PIN family toxin of toxin-antitoxin system